MKKITTLFLLVSINVFSQIYVGATTPLYVKNQVLFVNQGINLAANSNVYLRNNSQLLQGTSGTSTNSGTGTISVYQEGTSDNFEYNYWCSPVGTPSAGAGNTNFGIALLNRPSTVTASTPATILPLSSLDGTANPLAIASRWIYKLTNADSYWQWVQVGSASTIAPGEGFTMKGTSGTDTADPEGTSIVNNPGSSQRYDFRGKPNDGNISVSVGAAGASTLTGNPYPSALHLNAFLLDPSNSACTRIAYFWEQDKTTNSHYLAAYRAGYGAYAPMSVNTNGVYTAATFNSYNGDGTVNTVGSPSGIVIERRYSPIGQGFIIYGNTSGTVTFRNSHRIFVKEAAGSSQFEKPSKVKILNENKKTDEEDETTDVPHFKINTIINNQFTRQIALAFLPEATDNIDAGMDALSMDDDLPNDVLFWLEDAGYVIQGVNFDVSKKIPLHVKATASSTFKFSVPIITNFDPSQNIYLYDALDSSYHDIKNSSYEVTLASGVYNDRFKIAFKNETLGIDDNNKSSFFIAQDNYNQLLKASNPDTRNFKSFSLYDISGKKVLFKNNLGTEQNYSFSTSGLSYGVYIAVFLTDDNEKISQKIIISNSRN
jgi:hypothetical protein